MTTTENQIKLLESIGVDKGIISIKEGVICINGGLYLRSLKELHPDALKGTTINGGLYLSSLKELHPDALKGTTINGSLDLSGLTEKDRKTANSNVIILQEGYNEEQGYCFFDGILSKVLKTSTHKGYTLYETPFEFVAQQGTYTAHGKTVKQAIQDLEFKKIAEKLKNEPITANTVVTVQHYRIITGACQSGVEGWMRTNGIEKTEMAAKDLLPLLEKTNAYGLSKFKELVTF